VSGYSYTRVAINTFFLTIADIANKVLMFFFYVLAARHLGVERFGVLSFGFAFATMFSALTDLGLGAIAAREIARDSKVARYHIHNALGIKSMMAILVIGLIWLLVNILGYPLENRLVVYICSLFVFETAFTAYFCYIFQGFQRMEYTAVVRIVQSFMLFTGVLLLRRSLPQTISYAWLYTGAGLSATVAGGAIIARQFVPLRLSFDIKKWARLLRDGLPIGIGTIFVLFYYWNGSTLLSKLSGDRPVGIFNAAFRLVIGLSSLGISFSTALYPVFSNLFTHDNVQLKKAIAKAIRIMMLILLPIAALGTILAERLILLIYGQRYLSSFPVLRILVWWTFLAGFSSLFSNYFMATNRAKLMTVQTGLALVVNVLGNLLLIPLFNATGAALSVIAAEFVSVIFYIIIWTSQDFCNRTLSDLGKSLLRIFLASIAAALIVSALLSINWLASISAGLVVYCVILIIANEITSEDTGVIKGLLKKSR